MLRCLLGLKPERLQDVRVEGESQPGNERGERAQPAARDQPAAWQQEHDRAVEICETPALHLCAVGRESSAPVWE